MPDMKRLHQTLFAMICAVSTAYSQTSTADRYQWLNEVAATDGIQQAFDELEQGVPKEDAARVRSWLALSLLASDFKKLAEVLNVISRRDKENTISKKRWRAMLRSERGNIIGGATWRAIRSDKKAALDVIDRQLDGPEKDKALRCAVMQFIFDGMFTDAKEVIGRMAPGEERHSAIMNIALNYPRKNVPDTLEWCSRLEGAERADAVERILDAMVDKKDVEGFKSFLAWDREPGTRIRAIRNLISFSLEREDIAGVSSFVDTLAGDERTLADQHMAMRLAERKAR
jgi:hypothetical protein